VAHGDDHLAAVEVNRRLAGEGVSRQAFERFNDGLAGAIWA
jgi:predicted RNase H-like nuclease